METQSWGDYVRRVSGNATQVQIAETLGMDQTSVSRWLTGRIVPRAETVITVARTYSRSPVEALIAAGYLTTDEAGQVIEQFSTCSAV